MRQIDRVMVLMRDGQWRTIAEIAASTSDPEPSVSAQLRHIRRTGHYIVDKQRCDRDAAGFFEYRVRLKVQR